MPRENYKCLICGRVFPRGQGIIINYGDILLTFHSNRCASKFLRILLENLPREEMIKYVKRLHEELTEKLRVLEERKSKRI
ncbi:MAG: hypothetical protein ABWW65_07270 [Thermoprotei archaeon]